MPKCWSVDSQKTYFVTLKMRSNLRARKTLIPKEVPGFITAQITSKMLPMITCQKPRQQVWWHELDTLWSELYLPVSMDMGLQKLTSICLSMHWGIYTGHNILKTQTAWSCGVQNAECSLEFKTFRNLNSIHCTCCKHTHFYKCHVRTHWISSLYN